MKIGTAFAPVTNPAAAARWYADRLGATIASVDDWSAVVRFSDGGAALTLLGPASGISATPGLPWATCNFVVGDELAATRDALGAAGVPVSEVGGNPAVCLFFTATDLDGNTVLITDR